jgi:hypothetical protein
MMANPRWARVAATALVASLLVAGCDEKDSEKCGKGQQGVRESLKAGDSSLLNQHREYAFKYRDDGEFQALDREIQEHEAAKKKAEAEEKKKAQENEQLLNVFLGWVGSTKAAPQGASAAQCQGDGEAEKNQERWCVGDRIAGTHRLEVMYWEKEPVAAVYKTTVPHPTTCEALGGTVTRSWTVQGTIKRHLCQLASGQAAGMQALVTEAPGAPLEVFSARFAELHAGMKKKLEGM